MWERCHSAKAFCRTEGKKKEKEKSITSNLLKLLNPHHHISKMNVTKRMPMHIRKLHHCPLHSLNKGNIAQYSIVKHVIEINVHSLNYPYASTQLLYCMLLLSKSFFSFLQILKHKVIFFRSQGKHKDPYCVLCCVRGVHWS